MGRLDSRGRYTSGVPGTTDDTITVKDGIAASTVTLLFRQTIFS
jgi:hypothetical protein